MSSSSQEQFMPWMQKPYEYIFHAETHYKDNSDYSKRMSYISFDNAIEVTINTFIHLHTKPKGKKIFEKKEIKETESYFQKLELFEKYIRSEDLPITWDKEKINYYHEQRNHLYHDSNLSSPDSGELNRIRLITFWIFSVLFDIADIEDILNNAIEKAELQCPKIPEEYVKPIISSIKQEHETPLFIASILGGWDENSQGDNEIIKEVENGSEKVDK